MADTPRPATIAPMPTLAPGAAGTWSALQSLAERQGASVQVVEFEDARLAGSCWYEGSQIRISHQQSDLNMVLVLAHEVGHWLSYRAHPDRYDAAAGSMRNAEELAWIFGWFAVVGLGYLRLAEELWTWRCDDLASAANAPALGGDDDGR